MRRLRTAAGEEHPLTTTREGPHIAAKTQARQEQIMEKKTVKDMFKKKKDFSSFGEFPGSIVGWGDPLDGTATPSSILAWRIPWTEEPGGLWSQAS